MEKSYAQALWKMVESGITPHKAVASMREVLASHGREALLPHVAKAFARLAEQESKRNDIVLTVAREHDTQIAHKEVKTILEKMGVDQAALKTQVDDSLIGGWRLEGNGTLVDASYKNQLLELFNRVTAA